MIGRGGKNLPKEIVYRTTAREIIMTVAIALTLVVIVNVAALYYLARFTPNTGYLLIRAKWAMLSALKDPVALLILGDSSGNQGVDPQVFFDKLNLAAINLCTIGDATVLDDAWMLEDYLVRHGAPKAVVVVHGYDIWSRDINFSVLSKVPGSWWTRKPDLNLSMKDKMRIFLNRYVPLYGETASLAQILQNPWTAFRKNLHLRADGFMVESKSDAKQVIKDAGVHREFVRTNPQVLSSINRAALERIRELAETHKFDVFIVNGPVYEGLYADSAFQAYYAQVRTAVSSVVSGGRLHFILNPPMTFPADLMQSADHITSSAAVDYTARIAEVIKAVQDSSALPAGLHSPQNIP